MLAATFVHSFWVFVMLYGVGQCIGGSIMYELPIFSAWEYFPNHKALVTGIVLGSYGFGSFSFNIIATLLMNPNNENANEETGFFTSDVIGRVPQSLRVLTCCQACLIFVGYLTVTKPSQNQKKSKKTRADTFEAREEVKLLISGSSVSDPELSSKTNNLLLEDTIREPKITAINLIRTRQTFLLLIMMYLSSFFGYLVLNQYKVFGSEFIKDDHFLTLVGAAASIFSVIRIFWVFLIQKFSFKIVYSIMLLIQIVVCLTIYWTVRYKFLYLISV